MTFSPPSLSELMTPFQTTNLCLHDPCSSIPSLFTYQYCAYSLSINVFILRELPRQLQQDNSEQFSCPKTEVRSQDKEPQGYVFCYFGNRVHRPRLIGMGGLLLSFGAFLLTIPHFISERYEYSKAENAILFAISVFGPAFGYLLGSVMLRLFVDLDKVNPATIDLTPSDPRWIGAWWLGLLVSSSILAITSIPYFFFPREMTPQKKSGSEADMLSEMDEQKMEEMSLKEFIKKFPKMLARLLLNPLFIIIVIAQCSFSSMLAGLSTYFNKFLEQQYSTTASYANFLIGSIMLPAVAVGMILGGLFMKRFHLSLAKIPWCSASILSLVIILNIPLFFLGCSTQKIAGINYSKDGNRSSSFSLQADCNAHCFCSDYTYNPVCGVDAVEYISPCHAGCTYSLFNQSTRMIIVSATEIY
ncbi:solute carrier organic anion transporter family member 2A1-like isoform X5 [Chiloscyllium plagiosum]|uniref:solute carrier organic anion transporter family member 2A1-like isoform X5 n=1 Tax=Chiloscyllium plagiosum TaxID=36176 RepID=UPI001CB82F8A|nr:solute carrier organic anion transporter family member 2A1-like isoform X5 [Chiloscyllium plagiosum]